MPAEAACFPPLSYLSRETAAARQQQQEQQLIQGRSKEMKFRQLHSLQLATLLLLVLLTFCQLTP